MRSLSSFPEYITVTYTTSMEASLYYSNIVTVNLQWYRLGLPKDQQLAEPKKKICIGSVAKKGSLAGILAVMHLWQ